jgi:hypothetical protein
MKWTAKVTNGGIKLPAGLDLADGAEVQLTVAEARRETSFADRYATYIGVAQDLPEDLAANLDHCIHGRPKNLIEFRSKRPNCCLIIS